MNESRLEYTVEGMEVVHIGGVEDVQTQLKELHIESEISNENKLGIVGIDREPLDRYSIEELEDSASYIVDKLRCCEGILDVDYELGGEYPIELVIIF